MDQFARTVIGYHGCTEDFASKLLLGEVSINDWTPSTNAWDWLGHGIYFWEHAPSRAARWAHELCGPNRKPAVIGAIIQLGNCFDLLEESTTKAFACGFHRIARTCTDQGLDP